MTDAPIISARRNPAIISPARQCRAAYGPFCDAIRRLAELTPTQKLFACVLATATLKQGYTSLAFGSLTELTQVRQNTRPFAGMGKNDLSPALHALKRLGVVKMEERASLESGVPPVTMLLLIADPIQWDVPSHGWLFSVAEEREWVDHLLACRRRWTPQLPELATEADLHDARAAQAVESVSDALTDAESNQAACRGDYFSVIKKDALGVCQKQNARSDSRRRSESQNAKTPAKPPCVPKVRTLVSITNGSEIENEMLPIGSVIDREDLKQSITGADEQAFCQAARQIMGAIDWDDGRPKKFTGDGGKWRNRWRHLQSRKTVRAVFLDMLECGQFGGALAETRWKSFGGEALEALRHKN